MTAALVLPLSAAMDSALCGRKASRLAELLVAGFPVPDGFVVTTTALAEGVCDTVVEAVTAALDKLTGPVAVRSSGVAEDLEGASYAGQYETFLDVRGPEAVLDAIRGCLDSARAERVAAYG